MRSKQTARPNLPHRPVAGLMRCVRLVLAMLFAGLVSHAGAAGPRAFPGDSVQVQLFAVEDGILVVNNGLRLKLASGVLVFNESNRTVTRSRIPTGGKVVRLGLNRADEVQRIWILTADEIDPNPDNARLTRQRERPAVTMP